MEKERTRLCVLAPTPTPCKHYVPRTPGAMADSVTARTLPVHHLALPRLPFPPLFQPLTPPPPLFLHIPTSRHLSPPPSPPYTSTLTFTHTRTHHTQTHTPHPTERHPPLPPGPSSATHRVTLRGSPLSSVGRGPSTRSAAPRLALGTTW